MRVFLVDARDGAQQLGCINQRESHDERYHPEEALDVVEREEPLEVGRRDASADAVRDVDPVVGRQLVEVRDEPPDDGGRQRGDVADRPPFTPEGDLAAEDLELPALREEVGGNEHGRQADCRDENYLAVSILNSAWERHYFLPEIMPRQLIACEYPACRDHDAQADGHEHATLDADREDHIASELEACQQKLADAHHHDDGGDQRVAGSELLGVVATTEVSDRGHDQRCQASRGAGDGDVGTTPEDGADGVAEACNNDGEESSDGRDSGDDGDRQRHRDSNHGDWERGQRIGLEILAEFLQAARDSGPI